MAIACGNSTEGISLALGISKNTVSTHRKRAYSRLGISSQAEIFARFCQCVGRYGDPVNDKDTIMERAADFLAIEQHLISLFRAIDSNDAVGVASCFSENGVWDRPSGMKQGHGQIAAEVLQRPQDRRIEHLITNLFWINPEGDNARVLFKSLAFAETEENPDQPLGMSLPLALDQYEAKLVRSGKGWSITRLQSVRRFAR